ncbi:hypothetical protein L0F63_006757 [Massospora cicadina]|nr:hypothetical protein L0F63_006757 [Massospora cicadina]
MTPLHNLIARGMIQSTTHAQRAVMGRFLATLVNEGLLKARIEGDLVKVSLDSSYLWFTVDCERMPLFEEERITLLDPDDIVFPLMHGNGRIEEIGTLACLVGRFLKQDVTSILKEMKSSVENLAYAYHHPEPLPALKDDAMLWEQSILEGHPTHPMNKARFTQLPMAPILPTDDLSNPVVHLFALPKDKVTVRGDYLFHIMPLISGCLSAFDSTCMVPIPVLELQIPMVAHYFPEAVNLGICYPAQAQASLRTVRLPQLPHLNLKMALAATITSALRTITPWTTYLGPGFNTVADAVVEDKSILVVAKEVGSVIANHPDPDVQKHLSCIIRADAQAMCPGESVVVCAAITEKRGGRYILPELLNLHSIPSRIKFLEHYATLLLTGLLKPVVNHGLTFEAHLQNTLARFDKDNHLVGFCIRDFGGIKAHEPTLFETTGFHLDVWNRDACQLAHSLEDVYNVAYHTIVQMHLHRIVRALGLHYNCQGWPIIHAIFDGILPDPHPARDYFLRTKSAPWKAFLSMKFDGLYRDYLYASVPNLILLRPNNNSPTVSR